MKIFGIYSSLIVLAFAGLTAKGYAVSSLFGQHHHGRPGEHAYYGHSSFYHK